MYLAIPEDINVLVTAQEIMKDLPRNEREIKNREDCRSYWEKAMKEEIDSFSDTYNKTFEYCILSENKRVIDVDGFLR